MPRIDPRAQIAILEEQQLANPPPNLFLDNEARELLLWSSMDRDHRGKKSRAEYNLERLREYAKRLEDAEKLDLLYATALRDKERDETVVMMDIPEIAGRAEVWIRAGKIIHPRFHPDQERSLKVSFKKRRTLL